MRKIWCTIKLKELHKEPKKNLDHDESRSSEFYGVLLLTIHLIFIELGFWFGNTRLILVIRKVILCITVILCLWGKTRASKWQALVLFCSSHTSFNESLSFSVWNNVRERMTNTINKIKNATGLCAIAYTSFEEGIAISKMCFVQVRFKQNVFHHL